MVRPPEGPGGAPWYVAALISWGIALFEYLLQVPANRIGYQGGFTLAQLKITQEVITLAVFVPFSMFFMNQPFNDGLPLGRSVPDGGRPLHLPQLKFPSPGGARQTRRRRGARRPWLQRAMGRLHSRVFRDTEMNRL